MSHCLMTNVNLSTVALPYDNALIYDESWYCNLLTLLSIK